MRGPIGPPSRQLSYQSPSRCPDVSFLSVWRISVFFFFLLFAALNHIRCGLSMAISMFCFYFLQAIEKLAAARWGESATSISIVLLAVSKQVFYGEIDEPWCRLPPPSLHHCIPLRTICKSQQDPLWIVTWEA